MNKLHIKIRFNTNFPERSDKKWRVLVDDVQHLVDEIEVNSKLFSSEDLVKGDDGSEVLKYHVSTFAKTIEFSTKKGQTKAIIK